MNKETTDDIDFVYIVNTVWEQKKVFLKYIIILFSVGLAYTFLAEDVYTSKGIFIPGGEKASSGRSSKFSSLASLAGISLGGGSLTSDLSPALYKKVIKSIPFKKAMLAAPLTVPGSGASVSYSEYYELHYKPAPLATIKKYTIGLPKLILRSIKGDKEPTKSAVSSGNSTLEKLSRQDRVHFARMTAQLKVVYFDLEGYAELTANMPDALMAAELAQFAKGVLEKMVIDLRIARIREEMKFTEQLFLEKKKEYESAMTRLASFSDANQSIASAKATSTLQKLQADFDLAFSVYSELAKQLQQVRLQVKKDTPIFSVLEPVTIPANASSPNRTIILIMCMMLAILLGLAHVFGKVLIQRFKRA